MNAHTRKMALGAAAKVALAGTLLGCGKRPPAGSETTPNGATNQGVSSATAPSAVATDSASAAPTSACTVRDPDHPTPAELTCCPTVIDSAIRNDGKPSTPSELACCSALMNHNDELWNAGRSNQEPKYRGACCQALNWQGSMTCTPWGPPVPPTFLSAHDSTNAAREAVA